MLDVWSETQTAEIEKYVYKDRVAEISSPTGYEGGVGLYMPKTAPPAAPPPAGPAAW